MNVLFKKLLLITHFSIITKSILCASALSTIDISTPESAAKYRIHDTPESRKSGQTWFNGFNEKQIKYSYFLNGSIIDGTITVCHDSTKEQYHVELCFFVCDSLSKEECNHEIMKHTSRFHDFQAEYKPMKGETDLFSAYLVKTELAGPYEAINQFIPALLKKYNLSYINTTAPTATERENISSHTIFEDITSVSDLTTQASTLSTNRSNSSENDHRPEKRQRLIMPSVVKTKTNKKAKAIKQINGQSSILSFLQKSSKKEESYP